MADGEADSNPRTLKLEANQDAGAGQSLSDRYNATTGDKLSPKDYARSQEDAYYGKVSDAARNGHNLGFDKSTGKVFEYIEKPASGGSSLSDFFDDGSGDVGPGTSSGKNYNTSAALEAQSYFDSWQSALRDMDRATADAKEAKGSGGAAQSYMSSEANKTKEITRQYNDFQDRANELYDLMDAEQGFAMNADDQNAQNAAARAKGYLLPGEGLQYTPYVMGGPLSEILRPSLPDYVRPDYRMNAAVGLPGPEGFDDPQYDENGMPMYAYGTDWQPGMVPTAGLPGQLPRIDYPSWVGAAVDGIIFNLRDGSGANDGKPADWDSSRYGDWNRIVQLAQYPAGVPQAARTALYDYVQNSGAKGDLSYALGLGAAPSPSGNDYTTPPLTPSEQLARDQFEFQKTQAILKQIGGAVGSTSSSVPRSSSTRSLGGASGSGGNSGGSGSDLEAQRAADAQSLATYQAKRDIDLAYQQALNALQNDPNNPELAYKAAQLAETKRQFDEQMAYNRERDAKSLGLDTAKIIADYSANPGDAVAREYFLRGQAQPVGNAVNIFTGQPTGQQMTLSEVMRANAPLVGQALNNTLTGQPVEAQQRAAQQEQPAPEAPQNDRTPAYAYGTGRPEITPDGWTRAKQFIAGDPQVPGVENPEHIKLRVRNGEPEAKVTPISRLFNGRRGMPRFATGTDPWAWQGTDWNQADNFDAFGNVNTDFGALYNPDNLAQPQSGAYQPSTASSPVYNSSTGGSNITFGSGKDPYFVQTTSGVPYNASMKANDPFFGTPYQGMSPNAVVTNANSPYYGMTAQAAFDSQAAHNAALMAYNPASLDALGQVTGAAPAYLVGPSADIPGLYDANGNPRNTINVNNQAEAGILTGAQMQNGATQSANPGLPGYTRPADLPPLPGSNQMGVTTSTDTTEGGTQTDSVKPATNSAPPAVTATGKGQVYSYPGSTVTTEQSDDFGNEVVMSPGTFTKDGATWQLQAGDYRRPDGTWVRYDPVRKEYMPIQPNYTPVTSEAEFWKLPPDVQQKIFTGQPTGYALLGNWRSGLLAGLQSQLGGNGPQPMSDTEFQNLPMDQVLQLLENPPQRTGSYQPSQYLTRQDLGPTMGTTDGLLRLPMGGPTSSSIDYNSSLSQAQKDAIANMYVEETPASNPGTLMKPWDELTTAIEEKPGAGWQIYTSTPIGYPAGANPRAAGWSPTTIAIGPNGRAYQGQNGVWHQVGPWQTAFTGTANPASPDTLSSWLAENGYRPDTTYSNPVAPTGPGQGDAPAPSPSNSTSGATTGTAQGGTVTAPPTGVDFRDPATPPPGTTTGGTTGGATGGSTGVDRGGTTGGTTSGGTTTGGATGGSTQGNALAQALAQLLGLSYGNGAYQNLPSLLFASGGDAGQYDTVSNQPIEVPGLGISLPSASQMMNYDMLQKLAQNGSFDLLNSLYTAGNVPLSIILKMAEARAPRGSAYEPGLVSTV